MMDGTNESAPGAESGALDPKLPGGKLDAGQLHSTTPAEPINMPNKHLLVIHPATGYRLHKIIDPQCNKLSSFDAGYNVRFELLFYDSFHTALQILFTEKTEAAFLPAGPNAYLWEQILMGNDWHRRLLIPKPDSPATLEYRDSVEFTLDLDDVTVPGFDPFDPEPAIRAWLTANGITADCSWQITAGQKAAVTDNPRLRLFLELDKPYSTEFRKTHAKLLGGDGSVYTATQPNYTAPPVVQGGVDPIPARHGFIAGAVRYHTLQALADYVEPVNGQRVAAAPAGDLHAIVDTRLDEEQLKDLWSAMVCIPAHDREVWLSVGMGLKTMADREHAWLFFDTWSRGPDANNPIPEYNATGNREWWDNPSNEPSDTNWRSILTIAGDHGWINPQSKQATAAAASNVAQDQIIVGVPDSWDYKNEPTNIYDQFSTDIPEWNPDHYPAVISDLAVSLRKRMGVDPAIPCWQAMGVLCALVPDQIQLQMREHDQGWKESVRLWVAIVGNPAIKKSPAMGAVLTPLVELEAEDRKQFAREMGGWTMQMEVYKKQLSAWKKDKDATDLESIPVAPVKPVLRRRYISDATVEAAGNILLENPQGILCERDELTAWFGSMNAYGGKGGKDRGDWLSAFNGGSHNIDRISRGALSVPNWSISLIGGIQPEPMKKIARDMEDDGLLQRMLIIPARDAVFTTPAPGDDMAFEAYMDMSGILAKAFRDFSTPQTIHMSPEAQAVLEGALKKLHEMQEFSTQSNKFKSALAKGQGIIGRIALLFHICEGTDRGGPAPDMSPQDLQVETMQRAVSVYFEYLVPSLSYFYTTIVGAEGLAKDVLAIADLILRRGPGKTNISSRDIYKSIHDLKDRKDDIPKAMAWLDLCSWVHPQDPKDTGRKDSAVWYTNATLHDLFWERAGKTQQKARDFIQKMEEAKNQKRK